MNALLKNSNFSDFLEMGFIETPDLSNDPRGTTWRIKKGEFEIVIDSWMMVTLLRNEKAIIISVDDLDDLKNLINFIE